MFNLPLNTKEVFIYTYSETAMKELGRVALAQIFFNDGSFICMIYQFFPDGQYRWRPPYMQLQQNGHVEDFRTMGGTFLDELTRVAISAQQRIKTKFREVPLGTTFKVTRESAEIVPNPTPGSFAQ